MDQPPPAWRRILAECISAGLNIANSNEMMRTSIYITLTLLFSWTSLIQAAKEKCTVQFQRAAKMDYRFRDKYNVSVRFYEKKNKFSSKEGGRLNKQFDAAWEFLEEYHRAVGQKVDVPFGIMGLEMRPISEAPGKREFSVQDGKIILGMKKDWLGNYITLLPSEIREKWEKGEQFPKGTFFRPNPMKLLWPFVNPTGKFRQEMKKLIHRLQVEGVEKIRVALHSELRALAGGQLDGIPESELEFIRANWIEAMGKESTAERLLNAATSQIAYNQMPNYTLNLSSYGINVGNIHDIQIGIQTGDAELVGVDSSRPNVHVTSNGGLVNVFTIDRIHVQINFQGSIEKLGLKMALSLRTTK